ncbi:enoyl-CoA hydratase/isomerase family protein [Rubinisphaera margarita]|uniref:enoyl-CoA hydratase/isomerase family protein n=1 Tax=Rubinisphaera margarita TaxID=2909586 RepID=UPI001EE7C8BB|nr:enoyl-CoA hydratase/isomerase family protein [Rubinisphaera margarita]MCG6156695.1 enoyl-CoA hydratase/isomerase family protein [Rubinisphaera margarita]
MRDPDIPQTTVDLSIADQVATLTLSGPKGIQTLGTATRQALHEAIEQLEQNAEVRIVVVRGTGRTFVAGADIQEFRGITEKQARVLVEDGQALMNRLADLSCVKIAAINGPCAGGGWELALACDYRIAVDSARIGLPEVSLGLLPCWGGTVRMTEMFGSSPAKKLILRGDLIPAGEALQLGLIDDVAAPEELDATLEARIQSLLSRSPFAQREAARAISRISARHHQTQLGMADELNAFLKCVAAGQVEIGVQAFLDKTPPQWG